MGLDWRVGNHDRRGGCGRGGVLGDRDSWRRRSSPTLSRGN